MPEPSSYLDVTACEWTHLGVALSCFEELDELLTEDPTPPARWMKAVEKHMTSAMREAKEEGLLDGQPFEPELLLGIQFPEPTHIDIVERSSAALSAPSWHALLMENCERHRRNAETIAKRDGPKKKATKKKATKKKAAKKSTTPREG